MNVGKAARRKRNPLRSRYNRCSYVGRGITIYNIENHMYGDGVSVAFGNHNMQSVRMKTGDLDAFLQAIQILGLRGEAEKEVIDVINAPVAERPSKLQSTLQKIRTGAFSLAHAASAEVIATQVEYVVQQFLGQN